MLKNAIWLFALAFIVLVVFLPSYTKMQDLREKNNDYAYRIKQLTEENRRLAEERIRLEDDPVYLEKIAREKMGIVKEGEFMYKIVPMNKVQAIEKK